jgi:hypothetical protein
MQRRLSRWMPRVAKRLASHGVKLVLAGILAGFLAVSAFANAIDEARLPDRKWIIAPRFLTLQQGISKEEAREWLTNEYLPLYRQYPGFNAMLGEPLRSGGWGTTDNKVKEKGDFVLIYVFDTKETKDRYFPESGGWSDEIATGVAKHQATFDKLFGKYFVQDKYQMEEYVMFASAK